MRTEASAAIAGMCAALLGAGICCRGQTAASEETEISVVDSRIRPLPLPEGPATFSSRFQALRGVSLGMQGGPDGQVDISIRGSSFSEAGISLEGTAVRNPQTEHFNIELPIPAAFFDEPRVLEGMEEILFAPGHPAGSVALDFGKPEPGVSCRAGFGESGWNWQEAQAGFVLQRRGGLVAGARAFAAREFAESFDEAGNGLDRIQGGCHVQARSGDWQTDAAAGHLEKTFDASGFYGAPSELQADERIAGDAVVLRHEFDFPDGRAYAAVLWQGSSDRYRMRLPDNGLYENRHSTERTAGSVGGSKTASSGTIGADWRAGAEYETIESVRLGDHSRRSAEFLLSPHVRFGPVRLTAGGRGMVFDGDEPAVLGLVGLDTEVLRGHTLRASWTQTVRRPSYTELNYNSPVSLGRAGLPREETDRFEAGWSFAAGQRMELGASLFEHRSSHVVDWVKAVPDALWTAADLGDVVSRGAQCDFSVRAGDRLRVGCGYTFVDRDIDADFYAGRYVADYPRHLLQTRCDIAATETLSAVFLGGFRWQVPTSMREGDDFGADGSVAVRWSPRFFKAAQFTAGCVNLWDASLDVPAGTPKPERRVWVAFAMTWR